MSLSPSEQNSISGKKKQKTLNREGNKTEFFFFSF